MKTCQEVEWLTTEELIAELMSRETFMGIIIRPAQEIKEDEEIADTFTLSSRGLAQEHLVEVLHLAIGSL